MNLRQAHLWAQEKLGKSKIKSAVLDAEVILSFIINLTREKIFSHPEIELTPNQMKRFQKLILRRAQFEPIAYLICSKEFYGLNFKVNRQVLIPRPETEILVKEALKNIYQIYYCKSRRNCSQKTRPLKSATRKKINIVDIGTGSGAIIISIIKNLTLNCELRIMNYEYYASDISPHAISLAEQNSKRLLEENIPKIKFIKSDLFANFPKNLKFDFILANLPYLDLQKIVKTADFQTIKKEPATALDGGRYGLEIYKKFFQQLPGHIKKSTKIFLEIDPKQKEPIKKLAQKYLKNLKIKFIKDLSGRTRIVKIYF